MITLIAALWLQPVFAQEAKRPELQPKVPTFNLQTHSYTFPSGLRLLIQPDTSSPTVVVSAIIGGGGLADQAGKAGTAHLLQHLSFHAHGEDELSVLNAYYGAGVDHDGDVTMDATTYTVTGTPRNLNVLIDGIGRTLSNPLEGVGEEHLQAERQIMLIEPLYHGIGRWRPAWRFIFQGLHGTDDPLFAAQAADPLKQVANVTIADLKAYADVNYIPDNVTIAVVGNITPDDVTSAIFEHFTPSVLHPEATGTTEDHVQKFLRQGIANPDIDNPAHTLHWMMDPNDPEKTIEMIDAPGARIGDPIEPTNPVNRGPLPGLGLIATPVAVSAWQIPPSDAHGNALAKVTAQALHQSTANEMGQLFEVRKDPATGGPLLGCVATNGMHRSYIVCYAYGRDSTVNMDNLADRLTSYTANLWDPEQMQMRMVSTQQAKEATIKGLLLNLDDLNVRASSMARNVHATGSVDFTAEQIQQANSIEPSEIVRFAETWLQGTLATTVVLNPVPWSERVPLTPSASFHGALLPGTLAPSDILIGNDEVADALVLPDLSGLVSSTLSNGLEILVLPHGKAPLAFTILQYNGGGASGEGLDRLAQASVTLGHKTPGWANKPELSFNKVSGKHGAGQGIDSSFQGVLSSSDNIEGAMYLLRHSIELNAFNNSGRTRWLKDMKKSLRETWYDPNNWARSYRNKHILPGHPATKILTWEDIERLSDIPTSEVESYQKQKFSPGNTRLWVMGQFEAQSAIEQATTYFTGWKNRGDALPILPDATSPKAGKPIYLLDAPDAGRTVLIASCQLAASTHENRAASQVVTQLADERLATLLVDNGAPPLASVVTQLEAGSVRWVDFTAVVPNDKAGVAKKTMDTLISELSAGKVDEARLQQLKLRQANKLTASYQGMQRLQPMLVSFNESADKLPAALEAYGKGLIDLDGAGVKATVGACADHVVYTIEGPLKTLEAYGWDAETIDWMKAGDDLYSVHDPKGFKKILKQRTP
ncbi:MAG: hypothetical protein GWP91_14085 [Rhodobacterales bacterium]|nr:hypothetical protein [Rhodobacterales bacterium]